MYYENLPSLLTMLKSYEAFFVYTIPNLYDSPYPFYKTLFFF